MSTTYHDLLWGVRRSIRYHSRRRLFFDRFNTITNAIALLFGSATIFALFKFGSGKAGSEEWLLIPPAIVTLFSTFNLLMGSTRKAQLHHDLVRKFVELEQSLLHSEQSDEQQIRGLQARRLEIEAEEPPIHRIVDVLCHNELLLAEGYDFANHSAQYYKIGPLQRFFSPFFDLCPDSVRPMSAEKSAPC